MIDIPWTFREKKLLERLSTPDRVQTFLNELPYRCEDVFPAPVYVLRDGKAHCFDGALLAAAALRRTKFRSALVNLRAINDDDHLLCVYTDGKTWGSVAKSNFPSLRGREKVYRSLRELVMSYFDTYCNLKRERTLRAFSLPIFISNLDSSWEWKQSAVDKLGDRLVSRRHTNLLTRDQSRNLKLLDERSFRSQMVGVDLRGAYNG